MNPCRGGPWAVLFFAAAGREERIVAFSKTVAVTLNMYFKKTMPLFSQRRDERSVMIISDPSSDFASRVGSGLWEMRYHHRTLPAGSGWSSPAESVGRSVGRSVGPPDQLLVGPTDTALFCCDWSGGRGQLDCVSGSERGHRRFPLLSPVPSKSRTREFTHPSWSFWSSTPVKIWERISLT
jgi:hypothetical protein